MHYNLHTVTKYRVEFSVTLLPYHRPTIIPTTSNDSNNDTKLNALIAQQPYGAITFYLAYRIESVPALHPIPALITGTIQFQPDNRRRYRNDNEFNGPF